MELLNIPRRMRFNRDRRIQAPRFIADAHRPTLRARRALPARDGLTTESAYYNSRDVRDNSAMRGVTMCGVRESNGRSRAALKTDSRAYIVSDEIVNFITYTTRSICMYVRRIHRILIVHYTCTQSIVQTTG